MIEKILEQLWLFWHGQHARMIDNHSIFYKYKCNMCGSEFKKKAKR